MTRNKFIVSIGILIFSLPAFGMTAFSAQVSEGESVVSAEREISVELFVTSWCPHCHRAQKYLKDRGIPFVTYDVEKEYKAAQRMRKLNPRGGVPVAVIGDEVIVGFAESAFAQALQEQGAKSQGR